MKDKKQNTDAGFAKRATDYIADMLGPDSTAAKIKARRDKMANEARKIKAGKKD